jgi:hypothetical protein
MRDARCAMINPIGSASWRRLAVIAPDLPELEPYTSPRTGGDLLLSGVLIEGEGHPPVRAGRIRLRESELRGVRIDADHAPGLELVDVVLRGCSLTNVDAREGFLRRVVVQGSRLVGFGLSGGEAADLSVLGVDSLRGLQMPWEDVLASAGALATALGIAIED